MPRNNTQTTAAPPDTCVIYCRVSTDGQERDGTSLDTQEAACREYAARAGWTVLTVLRDTKSGATIERPALERARELLRHRQAAVLLVYALDRLSRDAKLTGFLFFEADRHRYRVEAVKDKLDDSLEGQMLLALRGITAFIERHDIRERTVRGKKARLQGGKLHRAGMDLYGYRRNHETGRREVDLTEAAAVREMFRLCVEERLSVKAIAARIQQQGYPIPQAGKRRGVSGTAWTRGTVHRILTNEVYKGVTWGWRWKQVPGQIAVRPRDRAEWIALPEGTSPAIVSEDLWEAAQRQLAVNRRDAPRNTRREYLLRGRLRCGRCQRAMYGYGAHNARYRCASLDHNVACGQPSVRAAEIETAAWCAVTACLTDASVIRYAVSRAWANRGARAEAVAAELAAARRALETVERRQGRVVAAFAEADGVATAVFQQQLRTLDAERRRLAAEVERLSCEVEQETASAEALDSLDAWCERWRANIERLDFNGKRLALEALSVRVILREDGYLRLEGSVPVPAVQRIDASRSPPPAACHCSAAPHPPASAPSPPYRHLPASTSRFQYTVNSSQ